MKHQNFTSGFWVRRGLFIDLSQYKERPMILYRPTGLEELLLVFATGMGRFPPRLPGQTIFYPVMNEGYAAKIASEWNTKSGSLAGYVTRFFVNEAYVASLPVRTVGASEHQELWVPSESLEDFNDHIERQIELVDAFFGDDFRGTIPQGFALKGKDAVEQLVMLVSMHDYNLMDFHGEIAANREAVFAHFPFWKRRSFEPNAIADTRRTTVLNAIRKAWSEVSPKIPLSDC